MWQWDRKMQGLIILFAAALLFAGGVKYAGWQALNAGDSAVIGEQEQGATAENRIETLGVHVAGAVSKPGVYYFPQGTRVVAALEKAGALPEADLDGLNLARNLVNEEKIYVPRQGESSVAEIDAYTGDNSGNRDNLFSDPASGRDTGGKVNINTASLEELDKLPGIGPVLAEHIIDYRNTHGRFRSPEDLKNVSGIGSRRFDQIKNLVTI